MRLRRGLTLLVASVLCLGLDAAPTARQLSSVADSLHARLKARTGVDEKFRLTRVRASSDRLDMYFSDGLAYYPWHSDDISWARSQIVELVRSKDSSIKVGRIFTKRYELDDLALPRIGNSGSPSRYGHAIEDPRASEDIRLVHRLDELPAPKGMDGRHIALWQSHGMYFDTRTDSMWTWQRAPLHTSVEDMLTPGFVVPFLIPMLENAGAYVMTPRERDFNPYEIVCDNDRSFAGQRDSLVRHSGHYDEYGTWLDAGEGFADFKEVYTFADNPFKAGSARMAPCSPDGGVSAVWTPEIPRRGTYAVYVSYKTLPESSPEALYTVRHLGGESRFSVDQRRGGGTWIYLGSFEFAKGGSGYVKLENTGHSGAFVSADAVKFGGGMGKLERGGETSGVSAAMEGAHYWMQWAGADTTITRHWEEDDYTNDFATRGLWTTMMREEKQIPFDLSLAFHTDAGLRQNDSIVGTLAIYTLRNESDREFSDGRDRIISRLLCDYVQTQIVSDVRARHDSLWQRRGLWDKSYSESRTTGVPAMVLELLSHQNFQDMKYALDPTFRFTTCRAVYKGILKSLSEFYGCPYVVQPLPVKDFSADLDAQGRAVLSWAPRPDSLEPTAVSEGYIVYTRIDDGAFDLGRVVSEPRFVLDTEAGHVYSFKVVAFNGGGRSFPSEVLSVGRPVGGGKARVMVVNNFTKTCGPGYFDGGEMAGFNSGVESAVPYLYDVSYIGEPYEFRRSAEFVDNGYPGFGASYENRAGSIVAGNSFDYCALHGRLLMELGYAFASMSAEAFTSAPMPSGYAVVDLVCGKQGGKKFPVFTAAMKQRLSDFTSEGGSLLVSGSNIASDGNGENTLFLSNVLGIALASPSGTDMGRVGNMAFSCTINDRQYCVEHPDALRAAGRGGRLWLRYPSTTLRAAVSCDKGRYRCVSIGIPIESLLSPDDRLSVMKRSMDYLVR